MSCVDRAVCGMSFKGGVWGAPFILEDPCRGIERLAHQEGRLCPECFRRIAFVRV